MSVSATEEKLFCHIVTLTESVAAITASFENIPALALAVRSLRCLLLMHMSAQNCSELVGRSREGILYTAKVVALRRNKAVRSADVWHSLSCVSEADIPATTQNAQTSDRVVKAICDLVEKRVSTESQKIVVTVAENITDSVCEDDEYAHRLLADLVWTTQALQRAKKTRKGDLEDPTRRLQEAQEAAINILLRCGPVAITLSDGRTARFWCHSSQTSKPASLVQIRDHLNEIVSRSPRNAGAADILRYLQHSTSLPQLERRFDLGSHDAKQKIHFATY